MYNQTQMSPNARQKCHLLHMYRLHVYIFVLLFYSSLICDLRRFGLLIGLHPTQIILTLRKYLLQQIDVHRTTAMPAVVKEKMEGRWRTSLGGKPQSCLF